MKIFKRIMLILLIVIIALVGWFIYKTNKNGGGLSGALATVVGHDENTKKNLGELKVLIVGVSNGIEAKLSDTIMVASYNPNTQKATLLSIPRDTYMGRNKNTATANDKINAIYSYTQDPEKLLKAVNDITNLGIKYYVVIETEALVKVVDAVGGITFNVPIDMDYDDVTQDLYIHLKAGEQLLDGKKAEQVVRFRHNNNGTSYPVEYGDNDLGRMRTQREFLTQVMNQILKPENIFKVGEFLEILNQNVKTNISLDVAKDYIPYAVEFKTENLLTETLPGTSEFCNNVWIYTVNKTKANQVIQKVFYDRDIEIDENIDPTEKKNIKIEIINGSGDKELLEQTAETLKNAGYTVKEKSTTNKIEKTVIANKANVKEAYLNNIRDLIQTGTIGKSQTTSYDYDVSIILGEQ